MEACNPQSKVKTIDRTVYAKIRELFDEGLPESKVCQGCGEERPQSEFGYSIRTKALWLRCFDCVDGNVPLRLSPEQEAEAQLRRAESIEKRLARTVELRKQKIVDGLIPQEKACEACELVLPHTSFGLYWNTLYRRCDECRKAGTPDTEEVKRQRAIQSALKRQKGRCSVCECELNQDSQLRLRGRGVVECSSHPFFPAKRKRKTRRRL